tara:strand:- start:81 stop:344 length:264 start_codon:yes stop_codon:yes gene_type:complete
LEEYKLKHKRLTNRIKEYLIESGPKDTREIQDYCNNFRNNRTGSKSNPFYIQSMNVISNIMRRKYFVKLRHDEKRKLDIWEVKEEYK